MMIRNTMTAQRFPNCNCNEDCIQEQGTAKNYKNNNDLTPAIKCQSVAVAMAGKIRGAINAYLELFVTFWGDAKK
jgi:hypothetical protein